jgi:two-component system, cell cycle sensor histidine kinase and response regulator CckA
MARRILIVEDDDNVRNFTVKVLKAAKQDVLTATSVDEARTILSSCAADEPICLVVDLVLNRQSGLAFAQDAMKRHPACRVLLISGFTDGVVISEAADEARMGFLPKPFTGPQLTDAIAAICR